MSPPRPRVVAGIYGREVQRYGARSPEAADALRMLSASKINAAINAALAVSGALNPEHAQELANRLGATIEQERDPTNLSRAATIVEQIERVRGVQRELRAAFARSELDGGAKAAPAHPLYADTEAELERLHAALMILI